MFKGQDIVVLAAMLGHQGVPPTIAELAERLSLDVATIHRSLARLAEAGLVSNDREVQLAQADEFFGTALRYVFPPRMKGETRGVPTAWAATPLREQLTATGESPLVWAHPLGEVRGIEIEPLHPRVPQVALRDRDLYERFALIDALRAGDARVRDLARRELQKHVAAWHSR
jgi:hypothetical protein